MALSPLLAGRLNSGGSVYSTNAEVEWPSGRKKTLDLAVGLSPVVQGQLVPATPTGKIKIKFDKVHIACEAKSAMTEHVKAKPRIYDELSNSHQLIHREDAETIACGITVVNIADKFASPLRQTNGPLQFSVHRQPHVTASLVDKLRTLQTSSATDPAGFDAYATIVVSCDNVSPATLWTASPAPQPGEPDHYETFLSRIVQAYQARFP